MRHIQQVTVFGGSGFVGRQIARALAHQGYRVRIAARRPEFAESIKTAGDVGQVMLVRANLRMPSSVASAVAGSQAVINAAGIPFERGKQRYQEVHVTGAWAIAEASAAAGVQRVVHLSGIGADDRVTKNRFVRSKVEAESSIVRAFPNATILRPSVVFGPEDAFFNKLAGIASIAPFVPLVGDGSAKLQPVYVGDVARAAVAVLEKPETAKNVFELGGPRVYTYRELVALTLRVIDRKRAMVPFPAGLMKLAGFFAEFQPALLGPPPITRDQADLLTRDNVVHPGAKTLVDLGLEPTAAEAILPTYLDRFRPTGRYNQHAPA
jgi:uncharacterized protein YbjT (DUF2867 family)